MTSGIADHVGKGKGDQQHQKKNTGESAHLLHYDDLFRRPSIKMKKKYMRAINKDR